jgi:hypothetical protein
LIGESASARSLVATDIISIAAAARLKDRTRPRLQSGIFIMRETPRIRQRKPRQSQGKAKAAKPRPQSGLPSAYSFAIARSIKLKMTT